MILLAEEGGSYVTSRDGVERQDAAVCCECLIKTDIKLLISSAVRQYLCSSSCCSEELHMFQKNVRFRRGLSLVKP